MEKEKHDTVEVKCCVVFFGVLQIVLWVVVRIVNKNFITGCSLDCDFFNNFFIFRSAVEILVELVDSNFVYVLFFACSMSIGNDTDCQNS